MSKRFKAAILGGAGYGSAEMIRRLLLHPDVELCRVTEVVNVGEPISSAHPHLEGLTDLRFEKLAPAEAAQGMDVVLLGLPHKVSATVVPALVEAGARVVDMSGDFRLTDAKVYERYYGAVHPAPKLLGTFVYGLPELNRERIRGARFVAAPGCFATTLELGLLPAARMGWLDGQVVRTVGMTGSSGSGAHPGPGTHHPVRAGNLRTYKPLDHQHLPEVLAALESAGARGFSLQFVPVSAPLARGIFATSFVDVPASLGADEVEEAWRRVYQGERFVRVVKKRYPEVAAVAGSNSAEVGYALGESVGGRRTLVCFSALDNLIKGGAGQAIQAMNLMLGCAEAASLEESRAVAAVDLVVKVGGEILERPRELAALAGDVAQLGRVVLVHGGGPQATRLQKRLGQEPLMLGGRRVTDSAALEVMKMTVAGQVNVNLCAALVAAGARPVGLHGASGPLIRAHKRPPRVVSGAGPEPFDLGHVGDVDDFNLELLLQCVATGRVPVVACLAAGADGAIYNINADVVANQLAAALRARVLVLVTSAPGVLREVGKPETRIPRLTLAEARAAIADGTVAGGMIPKLEESFAVLDRVGRIVIAGDLAPGDLRRAIEEPGSVGTTLTRE